MENLAIHHGELTLYKAGSGFPCVFFRDQTMSGELIEDPRMIRDILIFGARNQGQRRNPYNGEQPGAMFHEINLQTGEGIEMSHRPGRSTKFSASDTTALFLRGHRTYQKLTGDTTLATAQRKNIEAAAEYILSHISPTGYFFEDPTLCDATSYALKVTYWKDSDLLGRVGGEPSYPVIYTLAHAQNTNGLQAAADLLDSAELRREVVKMKAAYEGLYDPSLGTYILAWDSLGKISAVSTDPLHALVYLDPEDIDSRHLESTIEVAKVLETAAGYVVLDPRFADQMTDLYHVTSVWPPDNAFIHKGAGMFKSRIREGSLTDHLSHAQKVSSRVMGCLKSSDCEILDGNGNQIDTGSHFQLWTIASKRYFDRVLKEQNSELEAA